MAQAFVENLQHGEHFTATQGHLRELFKKLETSDIDTFIDFAEMVIPPYRGFFLYGICITAKLGFQNRMFVLFRTCSI